MLPSDVMTPTLDTSKVMTIAEALSRPPDLKTTHGAVQNPISLVIDRISPDAPAKPKEVRVAHAVYT
jgi:hypothetical protein